MHWVQDDEETLAQEEAAEAEEAGGTGGHQVGRGRPRRLISTLYSHLGPMPMRLRNSGFVVSLGCNAHDSWPYMPYMG